MTAHPSTAPRRRVAISVPGFSHRNPIPVASRLGNILVSGALTGRDPHTGEMPTDLASQCANAFQHVQAVVSAAGGTLEDIVKLTVQLTDPQDRTALNSEWVRMFPDAATRPARQVIATALGGGARIHIDLLAVLPDQP